jgi:hypothetical protein
VLDFKSFSSAMICAFISAFSELTFISASIPVCSQFVCVIEFFSSEIGIYNSYLLPIKNTFTGFAAPYVLSPITVAILLV